jgi:hypothetical protein
MLANPWSASHLVALALHAQQLKQIHLKEH